MYTVILSPSVVKYVNKLDLIQKERIHSVLRKLQIRPEAHLKKLVGRPEYSLRTGKYRIIVEIKKNILQVLVIEIGHRKNIYKK